jgi:hypothetical protein
MQRDSSRALLFQVERSDSVSAWETTEPVAKTEEASVTIAATPVPPQGERSMGEGEGEGEEGEEGDGYDPDLGTFPWPKKRKERMPLPYAGTHFDISDSSDPIAMMLLMAADPVALMALASSYFLPVLILLSVAVWVSGVRMCEELTAEDDQLCREMYVRQIVLSQEWFMISIVFASLAVPILLSFNRNLESVRSMWRFAVAVPDNGRDVRSDGASRKLRLAAAIKVLDIVQPLLALTVSAYVSLMLSEGEFFNVFLNLLVLEFVTTVDSAIVDNVLKIERFNGKPLSVALYPVREIHADQWDDFMSLGEAELKLRLRDLDLSNAAKWRLLTDVERGLGLGSPFPVGCSGAYDEGELNECLVRLSLVDWQATAPGDAQRWLSGMGYEAFREQLSRQQRLRLPQLELLPSLMETLGTSHSGVEIELSQSDSFSEAEGSPSMGMHSLAYLGFGNSGARRAFGAITTKGLCARKLISSCDSLARLSIKHSPLLVDDELMAKLGMHCPNLTHLHVDCQCPGKKGPRGKPNTQLTDEGLASLARCLCLSVLDLSGCTAFSDAGVTKLLACCHNLRELKLNFSPVTTAILKSCVDALALQRVELYKTALGYKDFYEATRINADGTNQHARTRRKIFVLDSYPIVICDIWGNVTVEVEEE